MGRDDSITLTQEPADVIFVKTGGYVKMVLKINHWRHYDPQNQFLMSYNLQSQPLTL